MKVEPFETLKVVLNCGVCGACPAVEISAEQVTIGEDANTRTSDPRSVERPCHSHPQG